MKWLTEQFGRALVRRLAFLLVAGVLAYAGLGRAHAAEPDYSQCAGVNWCPSEAAAYAAAKAKAEELKQAAINGPWGGTPNATVCAPTVAGPLYSGAYGDYFRVAFKVAANASCVGGLSEAARQWVGTNSCDHGIDPVTFQCRADCSLKPALGSSMGIAMGEVCVGGCMYSGLPTLGVTLDPGGSNETMIANYGGFKPTGAHCSAGGTPEPKDEPYCAQITGQTVCVRGDGQHCHKSASTSKFFCWKPGETGEKAQGPDLQKTNAGPTVIPPSTSLPSGDTLVPVGPSVTTTNIDNSTGATSTTTTNNYSTGQGTNAKPGKGEGVGGADGPGKGEGEGEGDGDGDGKGTMTGGSSCADPPSCVGGDMVLCGLLKVQHMTGCLAEDGIREFMGASFDDTDGTEGVVLDDVIGDEQYDESSVDDSGLGFGRSCPSPPAFYDTNLDNSDLCSLLQWVGVMIAALGLLQAAFVLGGER